MNRKIPIWIPVAILVLFLLGGGFGGNHFYKAYKDEIKQAQKKNDSILLYSQKREDSLINITEFQKDYSDRLREETDRLNSYTKKLEYALKKRNKQIFDIDTSFMSNARRMSESVNRFYQQNDSLRQASNNSGW